MITATLRHTAILAALLLATGISYYTFVTGLGHTSTFSTVILSAGFKSSLLLWFFMELRSQSWGLKLYSLVWLTVCVTAIAVLH
jgi:hypothetical protein